MMRSMYSGVSGLRVHQSRMDVIGNNIANVNTIGFKSSRVTFKEMFYQTLQGASGANADKNIGGTNPLQIGLGANLGSIDTIMTEGAAQRTDNVLDLKIEGEGFFVVSNNTGNKFTRAGAFRVDNGGNLVTPEGLRLMGWKADSNGMISRGKAEALSVLDAENMYSEPEQTTQVTISGNINQKDEEFTATGATGKNFTTTFFDSLGYKYTGHFTITEDPTPETGDYFITLDKVTDENGNSVDAAAKGLKIQGYDSAGTKTTGAATNQVRIVMNNTTGKLDKTGTNIVRFELLGSDSGSKDSTGLNGVVDSSFDAATNINMDLSQLTMFDSKSNIETQGGDKNGIGAGRVPGTMSGFNVGPDGKIQGKYTNGETKVLGQLTIANFKNPAGLQKIGNNLFEATPNSGDFDGIGDEVTVSGGVVNSGVLEMSNVDLSKEFTDMITTQRGFQANSRIITASDEMLQELVNLKR